ncbi:MAG: response regulator [Betaproteobacteria bacterium]|nr:response regulator [Betaproteobacteria bacterium]
MKPSDCTTLLVVDDDDTNRMIVSEFLAGHGYCLEEAEDGEHAWRLLREMPERFDAVLLDRMMPGIDGIEVLRRMKGHPAAARIPVILQTAAAAPDQVLEGLREGAFYYLTKPFGPEMLQAVVRTAVRDRLNQRAVVAELERTRDSFQLIDYAKFRFCSLDEARNLAALAAYSLRDAAQTALGLAELMINAVEHGNLGVTYQEKSRLLQSGRWSEEIESPLRDPRYCNRFATLKLERHADQVEFEVTDMGEGFDWHSFLDIHPSRAMDLHGRGIAIARRVCFDSVQYRGCGNTVVATKAL